MSNKYFAKVLLFGEYGILLGTRALSIPYHSFGGNLIINQKTKTDLEDFYHHIKLKNHLLKYRIDLELLVRDIENNLSFESNIPVGYGLGSSGALTAAIYKEYSIDLPKDPTIDLFGIKTDLALLESFFHGNSSGLDPLTSLLNKAILFTEKSKIRTVDIQLENSDYVYMLIDSGITGRTAGHVSLFKEKLNLDKSFKNHFLSAYQNYSDKAIDALIQNDYDSVFRYFTNLSEYQLDNMCDLIPENIRGLFESGLQDGHFALKICGSGGGGYFLAMVKSQSKPGFIHLKNLNIT